MSPWLSSPPSPGSPPCCSTSCQTAALLMKPMQEAGSEMVPPFIQSILKPKSFLLLDPTCCARCGDAATVAPRKRALPPTSPLTWEQGHWALCSLATQIRSIPTLSKEAGGPDTNGGGPSHSSMSSLSFWASISPSALTWLPALLP